MYLLRAISTLAHSDLVAMVRVDLRIGENFSALAGRTRCRKRKCGSRLRSRHTRTRQESLLELGSERSTATGPPASIAATSKPWGDSAKAHRATVKNCIASSEKTEGIVFFVPMSRT